MIDFAPAVRTNTAIVLALAGASGSGKTKSALELAVGLAGERGQTAMIDSEGRRGLHYADDYRFLHAEWRPPFTPQSLGEMLAEIERRQIAVAIVDSASDEHEGEGGMVDMAEAELQAQIKKGWEPNSASAWARPKAAHKHHIVRWLRQARCHVIFCLRAQEKVRFEQVTENGRRRTKVVPIGWTPICEKNLLYDVTTSLLFTPDAPGVPRPIKLYDKHRPFFPIDRQVSREAGQALARWAAGGSSLAESGDRPPAAPAPSGETDDELCADINTTAEGIARQGSEAFREWWAGLPKHERALIRGFTSRYQGIALEADQQGEAAAASDEAPGGKATTAAAAGQEQ